MLQEITGVLNTLVKHVESTEKEIKGVKIKLESSSLNSSTSDYYQKKGGNSTGCAGKKSSI